MSKDVKGLMNALRQFINEAILDSDDVAAAMAALKRTGKCPVFTIDVALEDGAAREEAPEPATQPAENVELAGGMVWSDSDVEFLQAVGIFDEDEPQTRAKPIHSSTA
jgi:hypothetical protein